MAEKCMGSGHRVCGSKKLFGVAMGALSVTGMDMFLTGAPVMPSPVAARRTICFRYLPYMTDSPFRCRVTLPILSRTVAVSSMRFRTLGARADPPVVYELRVRAKQAAKEIMMAVLLGID